MKENHPDLELGYFLVVMLDVLGQRDMLRSIKQLPHTAVDYTKTVEIINETAYYIQHLRERFANDVRRLQEPTETPEGLTAEQASLLHDLRRSNIYYRFFSDSVIISVPIEQTNYHCVAVNGIYSVFHTCCTMMLGSLADGHPLRAGLDIGPAVTLDTETHEVYGPVLERAYILESHYSQWPRISVGAETVIYLDYVLGLPISNPYCNAAKLIAEICKSLISADEDGQLILDYLGPGFHQIVGAPQKDELVRLAYNSVLGMQVKHMHNSKLSPRYEKVRSYFEKHLQRWGLRPQD